MLQSLLRPLYATESTNLRPTALYRLVSAPPTDPPGALALSENTPGVARSGTRATVSAPRVAT